MVQSAIIISSSSTVFNWNLLGYRIIIITNLFIEGSLAKALFCLRALFGATQIHSWIRYAVERREVGTFSEETFGYNCTPG